MSTYPGQPDPYNSNGQQPYSGQPGYGAPYGGYTPNPTEKNWMGITSLVLGILSFCCGIFTGIPAVIFGILGIQAANRGEANNKSLSIAGIVASVALVIIGFIYALSSGVYEQLLNG